MPSRFREIGKTQGLLFRNLYTAPCLKKSKLNIFHHNSNKHRSKFIKNYRHNLLSNFKLIKVINNDPPQVIIFEHYLGNTNASYNRRWPAQRLINTNNSSFYWTKELIWLSSDFIPKSLWPLNCSDFNPVDYSVWGDLQERLYRTQISSLDELKQRMQEWTRLS